MEWGVRPDGYSLHVRQALLEHFIDEHNRSLPDEVPDEYNRPSGTPYWCDVSDAVGERVKASKTGLRIYDNHYPGDGGTDGWKKAP